MITDKRQEIILAYIEKNGIVTLKELMEKIDVSEATIRRDLSFLENKGFLERIHGGAKSLKSIEEEELYKKEKINIEAKEKIGKYAADIVKDGESIFLDAGSTTFSMIRYLKGKNITVVTNGVTHVAELAKYKINTYIIEGVVKNTTCAVVGSNAIDCLKKFSFNRSFIGVNGIDVNNGFTTPDPEEGAIKKIVIEKSMKKYILADESKFNKISFFKFAELEDCIVITDKVSDKKYKEKIIFKEINN